VFNFDWSTRLFPQLASPRRGARRRKAKAAMSTGPRFEYLEARRLLAPMTFTVTDPADSGPYTLRAAITASNANAPGAGLFNTIDFNIAGEGSHTIQPTSALPTITQSVTIDGYSQSGSFANSQVNSDDAALQIELDGSLTAGVTNVSGLEIAANGCTVRGLVINRFAHGISLVAGASGNTIAGNFIGADVSGTVARPNRNEAVGMFSGANNNTIGGTTVAARNILSGNAHDGVGIFDAGTSANQVEGNFIGLAVDGNAALPNQDRGVFIANAALGNLLYGVRLTSTTDQVIGGTTPGAGNLISGNGVLGIGLAGIQLIHTNGTKIEGNKIGTDASGTASIGNGIGVDMYDATNNNSIGGVTGGAGNIIAFNRENGISIGFEQGDSHGDSILSNSIFSNGGPTFPDSPPGGILLRPGIEKLTNHLQHAPVLISAVGHADGTTTLRGLFNSTPNTNYRLEFFANPTADPTGFGQGQTFLDATGVTTDAGGNASFTMALGFLPVGTSLTATATDLTANVGDTSQFSNDIQVISHTPTLTSIAPSAVVEGPYTLVVNGGSFAADAVVSLNGAPLATTFINAGQLQAAVPAALAEEAVDSVTVSNPGPEGGTSSALPLTVSDAPLSASGQPLAAAEAGVLSGIVASFTDPGGAELAGHYSAVVDWGDGSSSQATLTPASGGFNVLASHSYEEEGAYQATTTIVDDGGATVTATSPVTIADGTLFGVSKTATFTEGATSTGSVASFEDADPRGAVGDYTATIDWGDGQTTAGTVVAEGAIFDVTGPHKYAADGKFQITVVVKDAGGANADGQNPGTTIISTAMVADSLALTSKDLNVVGNKNFGPATVATFTDADNSKPAASDYTATVTWDDGTTSAGFFSRQTTQSGVVEFRVLAKHHFASFDGYHTISVAITDLDDGGVTTVADSVLDPPGLTPNQIYVLSAYQDAFGAAGVTTTMVAGATLSDWAAKLDAGASHATFATALTHSGEYYGLLAGGLYQKYLGRAPDADGLAYWAGQMTAGMTDEQLEASFAGAPEFYQHAGGSDAGWVGAMYLDILGRAADAAGLSYWIGQLAQGANRAAVAHGFAASAEREGQRVSDDYFNDLGRAADAAGQAYWVNAFEHGLRNEDVVAGFLASDEYYAAHSA
jgi:hypothetical protein